MTQVNIFLELPFDLALGICSDWVWEWESDCFKAITRLDSALCNTAYRSVLLDLYRAMDFGGMLFPYCHGYKTTEKLQWVISRKIPLSSFTVSCFTGSFDLMMSFFQFSGSYLKTLKLKDFCDGKTIPTSTIASECKNLETLWLERCQLPSSLLADILNQATTLTDLRLQSYNATSTLDVSLVERILCPSVTKLAILDEVCVLGAQAIANAFPNASVNDLCIPSAPVLSEIVQKCTNMTILRARMSMSQVDEILADVKCASKLKRFVVVDSDERSHSHSDPRVNHTVLATIPMKSVKIEFVEMAGDAVRLIALHSALKLEVLDFVRADITTEGVAALADCCPNLRVLHVRNFSQQSNYEQVLKKCPKLQTLRTLLYNAEQMLASIAKHCANIEQLGSIGGLRRAEQFHVLYACPKLRSIEVAPQIHKMVLEKVARPGLEVKCMMCKVVYECVCVDIEM